MSRFTVMCYRMFAPELSAPDVWISGQCKESADYHAWHGRVTERREPGCYHGPFTIIPETTTCERQYLTL